MVYWILYLLIKVGILRELELVEGYKYYEISVFSFYKYYYLVCF